MQVNNELAAPELKVMNPPSAGLLAWPPQRDDNGLGFEQGSTDGVFNTYTRRGFHRPQLPVTDRATRRRFNLRGYRGAQSNWACGWPYACHYDPAPFYEEKPPAQDDNVWARHHRRPKMAKRQLRIKKIDYATNAINAKFIGVSVLLAAATLLFLKRR